MNDDGDDGDNDDNDNDKNNAYTEAINWTVIID